jgi:hypothetical protein
MAIALYINKKLFLFHKIEPIYTSAVQCGSLKGKTIKPTRNEEITDTFYINTRYYEESHNFGKVVLGTPVSVNFKFTNTGDQPLIISGVESSCGCTVPEYTKTPVKKGETGIIKVTFNPAGAALPFSKIVTITSNAKTSTKVLYIKGETVAK